MCQLAWRTILQETTYEEGFSHYLSEKMRGSHELLKQISSFKFMLLGWSWLHWPKLMLHFAIAGLTGCSRHLSFEWWPSHSYLQARSFMCSLLSFPPGFVHVTGVVVVVGLLLNPVDGSDMILWDLNCLKTAWANNPKDHTLQICIASYCSNKICYKKLWLYIHKNCH